jgi:hypothetical protein
MPESLALWTKASFWESVPERLSLFVRSVAERPLRMSRRRDAGRIEAFLE